MTPASATPTAPRTSAPPVSSSRVLHYLAVATTAATFPLIFMGGLVTTHDAGLSVPDWPNSYGYNMFLFPPSQWVAGIFYEHTHRLLGTVVGFCSILAALWAWGPGRSLRLRKWLAGGALAFIAVSAGIGVHLALHRATMDDKLRSHWSQMLVGTVSGSLVLAAAWLARSREPRRYVRWLAIGVLGAVIAQGVLGGLRVVLLKLDLAIVHACIAQAFLCLSALLAIVTSRWWMMAAPQRDSAGAPMRLAAATWLVIFAQLILGATMRHYRAGLSIPDLPLAFGQLLPPTSEAQLRAAQDHMTPPDKWWEFDDSTLTQVWLAFGHRVGAIAVSAMVIWLGAAIMRKHRGSGLTSPAILLLTLLLVQLTLGVLVVLLRKPADITSYHVAAGALVLLTTFVILVRSARLHWLMMRGRAQTAAAPDRVDPAELRLACEGMASVGLRQL